MKKLNKKRIIFSLNFYKLGLCLFLEKNSKAIKVAPFSRNLVVFCCFHFYCQMGARCSKFSFCWWHSHLKPSLLDSSDLGIYFLACYISIDFVCVCVFYVVL